MVKKRDMAIPFYLIAARCQNKGIGYKGTLPWSLRNEMKHFLKMTKEVKDPEKMNAVIMGRKTWDSLDPKLKPLPGRINFVLSRQQLNLSDAVHCSSFEELLEKVNSSTFADKIETAWVIGGSKVYQGAIELDLCDRFYLTEILQEFECDTFLDVDVEEKFREFWDDRVPEGVQEENGIKYKFCVYEKVS